WNLGCPSPMVSNRKRGSGLLPYPGFIDAFLKKVISRFPGKVSVKMRLGRKNESEIFDLLPVLNSYPLSEIIIHPRTGVQMYNGDVNLDTFERVLSLTNHEIVYSGDIWNVEKFQMLANRFSKITRWMLGRGALINPFLAAEIKGLETSPKKGKILKDFHDLLLAEYEKTCCGHLQTLGKMKGIWFYLSRLFPENPPLLKKMKRARKIPAYKEAANSFFEWQDKVSL
ncbi:MAG: tRNA-dihydrouridine synthase, partial [Nitrospinota bacterium]